MVKTMVTVVKSASPCPARIISVKNEIVANTNSTIVKGLINASANLFTKELFAHE